MLAGLHLAGLSYRYYTNMNAPEGLTHSEVVNRSRVIERQTIPLPGKGEDVLLESDRCVAVIDGVTGHNGSGLSFGGEQMSYGRWAAEIGARALQEAAEIDGTAEEVSQRTISHVSARLDQALATLVTNEAPTFVFAAYFPKHNLLIRVGDCSVLVDGAPVAGMPNDELLVEERKKRMREWLLRRYTPAGSEPTDELRHRVFEISRHWQWKHRNAEGGSSDTFGYGAIDGAHVPPSRVEWTTLPQGTHTVTLASDGVRRDALAETWEQTRTNLGPDWRQSDDLTYVTLTTEVVS